MTEGNLWTECSSIDNRGSRAWQGMDKYLLLIPCSKRKKSYASRPAIEIYDGPLFRAIRKYFSSGLPAVDIHIVSAKYGLIAADTIIEPYDQVMTPKRALEMRKDVLSDLSRLLQKRQYTEVLVNLLASYRLAMDGIQEMVPENTSLNFIKGPIGKRTSETIQWLTKISAGILDHENV